MGGQVILEKLSLEIFTKAALPGGKEGWLRVVCSQTTTIRLRGDFLVWSLWGCRAGARLTSESIGKII